MFLLLFLSYTCVQTLWLVQVFWTLGILFVLVMFYFHVDG